jgi:hypothetical protein
MSNKLEIKNEWYLISIKNPDLVNGMNVINVIRLIKQVQQIRFVVLDDIIGVAFKGNNGLILSLQNEEHKVLTFDVLNALVDVDHFEWGSFFLFEAFPANWKSSEEVMFPELIQQTSGTVRAVDGNYLEIYTPSEAVFDIIKAHYQMYSARKDVLENLDYPE